MYVLVKQKMKTSYWCVCSVYMSVAEGEFTTLISATLSKPWQRIIHTTPCRPGQRYDQCIKPPEYLCMD
jgi:hypothetical protein